MNQLSLFPALDRESDTRRQNLCRGWADAEENDCGVLTENSYAFEARPKGKFTPYIRIECGLVYPKCYYEVDMMDATSGEGHPLTTDMSPNFDIHEHVANVMLMVEHEVRSRCGKYRIPQKLIETVIESMRSGIDGTEAP